MSRTEGEPDRVKQELGEVLKGLSAMKGKLTFAENDILPRNDAASGNRAGRHEHRLHRS